MCVHTQMHMHAVSSVQLYPMSAFAYPSPQSRYVSPEGSLSLPSPVPQPWQPVVCSLFIILPFQEYFINRAMVHVSFAQRNSLEIHPCCWVYGYPTSLWIAEGYSMRDVP